MHSCITDVEPALQLFWTVAWVDVCYRWLLPFTLKKKKVGEPPLPRLAHLRQRGRQEDRRSRKCLKAQETALKLFPSPEPTPSSPTSLTAPPHWNIYNGAPVCWWPPSVNYLPAEMQEQSNWNEDTFSGDFLFFPCKDFSDPVGSRCHLLFCILKARWLQLSTISTINEFHRIFQSSKWDCFITVSQYFTVKVGQ